MIVRPPVYTGITGFKSRQEVDALLDINLGRRRLMVGVLANHTTIMKGRLERAFVRTPERHVIADIFPPSSDAVTLNLVHYSTRSQNNLLDQLIKVMEYGGPHCNGVQLNMRWPDPDALGNFRERFPEAYIVLQVGGKDKPLKPEDAFPTAQRVTDTYGDLIDYVLLDGSGGTGTPMDARTMNHYVEAFTKRFMISGVIARIGIAGGLDADSLAQVEKINSSWPVICWDAEGRLHNNLNTLDLSRCREYLRRSSHITRI